MSEGTVFKLEKTLLENVEDKAGLWNYEGGNLLKEGKKVGAYITTSRVLNTNQDLNISTFTSSLFFSGKTPPENLTLQGVWECQSGTSCGSVSAASESLEGAIRAPFTIKDADELLIKVAWD